jgi:hypothetical protein
MNRTALAAALSAALLGCAPPADTARPAAQTPPAQPAAGRNGVAAPAEAPPAGPAARRPESPQKFDDLRSLMQAKRKHERRGDQAISADARLRAMADLPSIRERCRQRFGTDAFDDQTLDRLSDWLCTTAGLTPEQVEHMPLSEVADRLDAAAGKP